jgi:DNA-binding response OmpR family regulator
LITALAQKEEEEIFKESEVDHYMIKPFDLIQLEAKIRYLLDKSALDIEDS